MSALQMNSEQKLFADIRFILNLNIRTRKKILKELRAADALITQATEQAKGIPFYAESLKNLGQSLRLSISEIEEAT